MSFGESMPAWKIWLMISSVQQGKVKTGACGKLPAARQKSIAAQMTTEACCGFTAHGSMMHSMQHMYAACLQ